MKIFALLVNILFLCNSLTAQEKNLKNIKYLYVIVEDLPENLYRSNLSEEQLKNDIELKLRQNGIIVNKDSTDSFLYLNINSMTMENSYGQISKYIYSVRIEINQTVVLTRDFSIFDYGITWQESGLGFSSPSRVDDGILGFVNDFMNRFLNDYLEVNR